MWRFPLLPFTDCIDYMLHLKLMRPNGVPTIKLSFYFFSLGVQIACFLNKYRFFSQVFALFIQNQFRSLLLFFIHSTNFKYIFINSGKIDLD
jgi:hypothetical protein